MSSERLLKTFLDLIRIDSPSGEEAEVAAYCAARLRDLGFEVSFDDSKEKTGSETGNIIAIRPGTSPGRTLVLSAHMDCVEPCRGVDPVVENGVVRSVGETILGGDDKGGIAAILEAVARMSEEETPFCDIRVLFTVSEETGLTGAKALDPEMAKGDLCLVLDADGAPGGIVVGAPTHYTFAATFKGTAAHAGVEPEKGISALEMAAQAISRMELGRLDVSTTANVGTIEGGRATNIVPDEIVITGECRSLERSRVEEVRSAIDSQLRSAATEAAGEVEIEWVLEYESFSFAEDDPLLKIVEDSYRDLGITPRLFKTGGGSDGSILSAYGIPTLVLSSGMNEVHGTSEWASIEDIESITQFLCVVSRRLIG